MKKTILFIFVVGMFLLQSCATVFSGLSDKITFKSEPPGAFVYLDGKEIGKTNNDIEVRRKYKGVRKVTYKKEGYQDLDFNLIQKVTPVYWLNLVSTLAFGVGLVGSVIDIVDGAALKPRDVSFEKTLEKK